MSKMDIAKIEKFCENMTKIKFSRKNLLKSVAILTGSLIFLGKVESVYAHPPSQIDITFDSKNKILKAIIAHPVSNPQSHFINKVEIGLNDKKIIEHEISKQDNNTNQTVSYLIPDVKVGDILSVEAYCNISGKLEKEIQASN